MDCALKLERTRLHAPTIQYRHEAIGSSSNAPCQPSKTDVAPSTLLCVFVFGLSLLLLLLVLLRRSRRLLPLMGCGIIQLQRQPQLRAAIRLIGKTQESLGQVLELLAEKLVFLRLGKHIRCLKTICICLPRHWRSPSASANPLWQSHDALQSFPDSA